MCTTSYGMNREGTSVIGGEKKKKVDTEWYQDYITLTGNGKKYGFDSRDDAKS